MGAKEEAWLDGKLSTMQLGEDQLLSYRVLWLDALGEGVHADQLAEALLARIRSGELAEAEPGAFACKGHLVVTERGLQRLRALQARPATAANDRAGQARFDFATTVRLVDAA